MPMNGNVSYGRAMLDLIGSRLPVFGNVYVVLNSSDSADPNYDNLNQIVITDTNGQVRLCTDLATAYGLVTTNNDDVIVLSAHTSHKVSSMLTISKNRVHFFGMDGGNRQSNQRTLISNTGAGASGDVSMIKVTGTGCTFENIAFKNNWTVAQNLSAVLEYGSNSVYKNCSFQNLGSAHLTNASAAPLILATSDGEFHNCNIGADTLQSTVASGQVLLISKGSSSHAATRVLFENCILRAYTNKTTHAFVRVGADGDIDRDVGFKNCDFINFYTSSDGALMAVAVASASGLTSGQMWLNNPVVVGATDLATAGVGNASTWVVGISPTAGSAGISVQPTA